MPVSEDYLEYVLDQLSCVGRVTARRMFGGVGLYLKGNFFGLIADNVLYFKVDDSNRRDYEAAGMEPFRPFEDKPYTMQYYEVPVDVLEDREQLERWARQAWAAAAKAKAGQAGKRKR